jgi:hypothetical protein
MISRTSIGSACMAGFACAMAIAGNVAGCFYDWDRPEVADAARDDAAVVKSDAGSDAATGTDGSVVTTGVCSQASPCPGGSYCSYDDHACGNGAKEGKCTIPPPCPKPGGGQTYCGCDGTLRDSECATFGAGFDLDVNGLSPGVNVSCKIDTGKYFACGYASCARDSEFCVATGNAYKCQSSVGCTKADCGCAQQETKCSKCTGDSAIGVTVFCP